MFYGDEDQNELMNLIDHNNGGEETMSNYESLLKEIEFYNQAIQDASEAKASAEQELNWILDTEYNR